MKVILGYSIDVCGIEPNGCTIKSGHTRVRNPVIDRLENDWWLYDGNPVHEKILRQGKIRKSTPTANLLPELLEFIQALDHDL